MFKINSAKGLTLVEVLTSVIITGIIITAMFPFFARIQGKQLSGGGAATLFQGAICSLETRRLHTLSRHSHDKKNRTLDFPTKKPGEPATQIGSLYDALRSEIGFYAMSENEIMPFSVVGAFRGGSDYNDENDFVYGNYITWTGAGYSRTPLLTYHRVFFFTTDVTALVSLTRRETSHAHLDFKYDDSGRSNLPKNFDDVLEKVLKGATDSGFGRYREYKVFAKRNDIIEDENYKGVSAACNSRETILEASKTLKDKRLFRIFTHYVGGIYETPNETTGHFDIIRV